MKFSISRLFLYIILILPTAFLSGQNVLRGEIVDDETGEPLIGASVIIKGTTTGTVTDFDGRFELRTRESFPFTVIFSYIGYLDKEMELDGSEEKLKVGLETDAVMIDAVEVTEQRISEKQKAAPLTVETMDVLAIKQTPSDNFYDGLGSLKGVDLTAASLGFKIINTRGFNSTSPVRSLQLIDGVDNQAPGLNFSLGNFLGSPELDVKKVELIVGAASAFYGPNAFNGVISMETKDPFTFKGLSASVKGGERNLFETAIRWADAVKNKDGQDFFGYKINFSYLRADDWVADNYDPVFETENGRDAPGGYDAVNIYGDEYFSGNDFSTASPWTNPGLGLYHRTGYEEQDLVNYDTRNTKANAAFHFRLNPSKGAESTELVLASNFGTGTTVYQGDNRFSLNDILFFQNRIEIRKPDKFFLRGYATHEDAGNSYDPYFTALQLQERAKTNDRWSVNYSNFWLNQINGKTFALGFPEPDIGFDPETNTVTFSFDQEAADAWLIEYADSLTVWHNQARMVANAADPLFPGSTDYLQPGTPEFEEAFNEITSAKSNEEEGGTRFFDKSALYHVHGEYQFNPEWIDFIKVGANFRQYVPDSDGTIFVDTGDVVIRNNEIGMYTGFEKSFFDKKLRVNGTIRADKNQNFNWISTPAVSVVWKPRPNNYLRVSYSSAIRNPTLTDQYLNLNVGPAILLGNLNGFEDLIDLDCLREFFRTQDPDVLCPEFIEAVRPEKVNTFELGYRTTLFNRLYVDAGYYYSLYNDFLGFQIGADLQLDEFTGNVEDLTVYRVTANAQKQVTTQGFSIGLNYYVGDYYMLAGNYSWNRLNTETDDPIVPAFNTPEHKFNIGFSGRNIKMNIGNLRLRNWGFNINYKWIEGFLFEGSPQFTGLIPTYDLLDAQINFKVDKIDTTFKFGASNILNNMQFQTYGGPRIGRLAYVSLLYEFQKLD